MTRDVKQYGTCTRNRKYHRSVEVFILNIILEDLPTLCFYNCKI